MMANRVTRRSKALISGGLHPHYRSIIETTAHWQGYRAVAGKAGGDGAADPARPARDEDVHACRGSGSSARADDGISSQPRRDADSRGPSSAFEEAWPRRSSRSISCSA
jgi:hypothetical protein